jgi:hypothetical protein
MINVMAGKRGTLKGMAFCLMTWESKILSEVYGSKRKQGVWGMRSNLKLQNAHKPPNIVTEIKVRRLEWLGYAVRMEGTSIRY